MEIQRPPPALALLEEPPTPNPVPYPAERATPTAVLDRKPVLLVGVDFSEGAAAAYREASALAKRLGGDVEVIYVAPGPRSAASSNAAAFAWLYRLDLAPATVTTRVGLPWVELVRRAREIGAMLVIIGRHGRSGPQPVALGSTAARLALTCPCPVVIASPLDQHVAEERG